MKKKVRNVSIKDKDFVYWYKCGRIYTLNITPKEDKNTKVSIIFDLNAPEETQGCSWCCYEILCLKEDTNVKLLIAEPKFISEATAYLINTSQFTVNKTNVLDGLGLLLAMGYTEIEPIWSPYW